MKTSLLLCALFASGSRQVERSDLELDWHADWAGFLRDSKAVEFGRMKGSAHAVVWDKMFGEVPVALDLKFSDGRLSRAQLHFQCSPWSHTPSAPNCDTVFHGFALRFGTGIADAGCVDKIQLGSTLVVEPDPATATITLVPVDQPLPPSDAKTHTQKCF